MGRLGFRTELMGIIGSRVASAASERAQRASERSDGRFQTMWKRQTIIGSKTKTLRVRFDSHFYCFTCRGGLAEGL